MAMSRRDFKQIDEQWLSWIPSEWNAIKIKYLFRERIEKGHPNEQLLVASQNMGVVPKDVYGLRTVEATKDLHLLKLVKVGDFVISLRSFQGGIEYAYYQGIISPAYTVMIPNTRISSSYFRYLAKSRLFIELLQLSVTGIREGQNIDYSKLRNHLIPVPPRPEQDQIVRYLDWQVSRIDRLIEGKKREIELLVTQEENLIATVVTSGIRREKKKQCDLIWLKSKPESWKTVKIKRVFRERVEKGFPKEPLLAATQNMGVVPKEVYGERTVEATKDLHLLKLVRVGDFVISLRSFQGGIEYAYYQGIISPAYTIMIPSEQIFPGFFRLLAKSKPFIELLKLCVTGIREGQNIDYDRLKNSLIPLPTLEEQKEIAEYLDQQSKKINTLREKLLKEVENLHELKTGLISDVVTGKVDVSTVKVER